MRLELLEFDKSCGNDISGVDEAGRGPWAGPVVAAAVALDYSRAEKLFAVNDSKKLTEKKREELYPLIIQNALSYSIAEVSPQMIDEGDILKATLEAMRMAVDKLSAGTRIVLIDGNRAPEGLKGRAITVVDGDAKSLCVAAASVLAKVHRDRIMKAYDSLYPGYGFGSHKGYGTEAHMESLRRLGPCPIHRKSFKPVKRIIEERG